MTFFALTRLAAAVLLLQMLARRPHQVRDRQPVELGERRTVAARGR